MPVSDLLDGRLGESVNDYFSISESSVERIQERLTIARPKRKVVQLKLSVGSSEKDIQQVSVVLNNMADRQMLLADTNGGLSVNTACEIIPVFMIRVLFGKKCARYTMKMSR